MNKFIKKNLPIICFFIVPIMFLWHPNWLGFLGVQPYWPLFWLLPWSMINGSLKGIMFGLFLGMILDSVSLASDFTQIPGLIICGAFFGRLKLNNDILVGHFRYGLICSFGSFVCGMIYFFQILFKNFPDGTYLLFFPSIENILAEVFLTGLFAPLICSHTVRIMKFSGRKVPK